MLIAQPARRGREPTPERECARGHSLPSGDGFQVDDPAILMASAPRISVTGTTASHSATAPFAESDTPKKLKANWPKSGTGARLLAESDTPGFETLLGERLEF